MPTRFCSKPDADDAAKAVMGALTVLGLWRDDAQVVSLIMRKIFGSATEVGARVTVATLEELALRDALIEGWHGRALA